MAKVISLRVLEDMVSDKTSLAAYDVGHCDNIVHVGSWSKDGPCLLLLATLQY